MQLCLMIEGQESVGWEDWLAIAEACERHGVGTLFRSDHYLSVADRRERGSLDAWTTLAALAARTSTLRLGTLVSPATFRHPSLLAKAVVTVDHVSGGRVELGLGAGWWQAEHEVYGFPFHATRQRMDVLEEQLEIVLGHWSDGPFGFDGRLYQLDEHEDRPRPVQQPHPPLLMGGSGRPRSARLAARFADEYNTPMATAGECRERREAVHAACEAAGRHPQTMRFSLMTGWLVGRDRAELRERATRLARWQGAAGDDADAFIASLPEAWIVGTVDEALEQLSELEAAGVERVMAQHLLHEDIDAIAVLGEDVVRALASRSG